MGSTRPIRLSTVLTATIASATVRPTNQQSRCDSAAKAHLAWSPEDPVLRIPFGGYRFWHPDPAALHANPNVAARMHRSRALNRSAAFRQMEI